MRISSSGSSRACASELYLVIGNIDHTRNKGEVTATDGIVEPLHKTMLNEFYRTAFRKKIYAIIGELQIDLDLWLDDYNNWRGHQVR